MSTLKQFALALFFLAGCGATHPAPGPVVPPPPRPGSNGAGDGDMRPAPYTVPTPADVTPVCAMIAGRPASSVKWITADGKFFCYDDSEATPADESIIPQQFAEAMQSILAVRPGAIVPDVARQAMIVRWKAPTYKRPADGMGFFPVAGVISPSDQPWLTQVTAQNPNEVINGQYMVIGYSNLDVMPMVVNAVANVPNVLGHEFVHLLWFTLFPDEHCPDPPYAPVYKIVQHDIMCDPFMDRPFVLTM